MRDKGGQWVEAQYESNAIGYVPTAASGFGPDTGIKPSEVRENAFIIYSGFVCFLHVCVARLRTLLPVN